MSRNFEQLRNAESLAPGKPLPDLLLESCTPDQPIFPTQFGEGEQHDWLRALHALARHWRWSLAVGAGIALAVAAVVLLMRPVYEPTARIEVASPGTEQFSMNPASPFDSVAYAATQANNLQSDELALSIIRRMHLDRNPDFTCPTLCKIVSLFISQKPGASGTTDKNQLVMTPNEHTALISFQQFLTVQRDPSSFVISVSFAAHEPKLASDITNGLIEQFIETSYRTRHDAIIESTQWLSRQLDDIRMRMDESNRALAQFQKSSGITTIGTQSTFDEKMAELNRQLTIARVDRIQLEAWLQKVSAADPETLPQINADPVVQDLSKKLAAAKADLNQALIIYGKNHPHSKQLQAQLSELESQLKEQQGNIYSNLKTSYSVAHTRENLLNSEVADATKDLGLMARYEALKKEAEANENLYNTLYTKVKEAGIAAESRSSNTRWVDRAPVLYYRTRPNRLLVIVLGILAGIVGGITVAFVREGVDSKVRSIDDVQSLTGRPSISLVPVIGANGNGGLQAKSLWSTRVNGRHSLEVFVLQRPDSAEAEALRGLFTSVLHRASPNRIPQVLLVVSAVGGEGKTTIATNLGAALASHGSTCIVDADLRKPRAAKIFGVSSECGLSEVLAGSSALPQALVPVPGVPNLTLLPSGSGRGKAGELVCSDNMGEVIRQLRQHFQFVIMDSPPILPYADARSISSMADGVILVGRSGVSTRQAIKRTLQLLEQARSAPIVEIVLNGVDLSSWEYRYGYGAAYR